MLNELDRRSLTRSIDTIINQIERIAILSGIRWTYQNYNAAINHIQFSSEMIRVHTEKRI